MEGENQQRSMQTAIRAAREAPRPETEVSVPIPGFQGVLVGRYKAVPWRQRRQMFTDTESIRDPIEREVIQAAETLAQSSVTVEAHVDGSVHDLGVKLGLELAGYLEEDGVENDRQAIIMLIPDEGDLMEHVGEILIALKEGQAKVDDQIVGESSAAS